MKATGVVRRIDNLGRIVIPKEIRKCLRTDCGDSLEIFVEDDSIILKKYSLLENSNDFTKKIIDIFYKLYNKSIIVTDRDKVIACSKNLVKEYNNKELSINYKNKILLGEEFKINNFNIILNINLKLDEAYVYPMICDSEVIGSIIYLTKDVLEDDMSLLVFLNNILLSNIENS